MKHALRGTLAAAAAAFIVSSAAAQPAANVPAILDSVLHSRESGFASSPSVVGAAIGIYWKGQTYYATYGLADKERRITVDSLTRFEIGSNTKVFTGLMLASEMAAGRLSGQDYLDEFLPMHKALQHKIRLTDIANHISGLPTFHDSASLAELTATDTSKDPLMLITDDYVLNVLRKVDTLHNYGNYEYSNFGVGVLGYLLQQTEKASYEQLLQRMICKPLQLKYTTTVLDSTKPQFAKGYYHQERSPFISLTSAMIGAGGIRSNITDMMTFVKAQLQGNGAMEEALQIGQQKFYKGPHLQIAMGWHIARSYDAEIYEMRGDTYGASSAMLFDKRHDLGIVILLNSANSGLVQRTQSLILAKLLDNTGTQDNFRKPEIAVDAKIMETYKGVYELEPGFDATVSVKEGKLWLQLTGQPGGAFKAVGENLFVVEKLNCQLEFLKNVQGGCDEFVLRQNEMKISCRRK
jgi:D-alanyl-D-alanine-carboxypeptidase/D-alanyl-D-alanine-endopeptidase